MIHPKAEQRGGVGPDARRRGVVIIIVLLAIILLTALVLFVINLGQQVNRRVAAQNTADATVAAGATWVARSLNTVSRNNVTMSRYIALVNVMDSLPQAVRRRFGVGGRQGGLDPELDLLVQGENAGFLKGSEPAYRAERQPFCIP